MNENKSPFTNEVLKAINSASAFALQKRYEYLTVDNLMLFMCDTVEGKKIFKAIGIDTNDYKKEVIKYLENNISKFPKDNILERPETSVYLNKILEQATILQRASKNSGKTDEGGIIVALFQLNEEDIFTLNYFKYHAITCYDVLSYIAHQKEKQPTRVIENKENESKSYLEKYAVLLNEKAKNGKVDPVIGRVEEINKVIEILAQRRKNNPILVGDPGVGKTAIAEGFAKRIVEGNIPEMFSDFLIYSLDLTSIVAGSKYRGDFEERLKGVIKEASSNPKIVLFIDEIHTLIGAGTSNGTMDASNIMKPALSSGAIKVIGATTYDEYRKYFEKEASLSRRFQKVDIVEPTEEQTFEILLGIKKEYEMFHQVSYDNSALTTAVKLTGKYISDKRFPDKAIDAIDMAGARAKLNNSTSIIMGSDISYIISKMLQIPVHQIEESDRTKLKNLELQLRKEIFGQEEAISKIVDSIILSRAALSVKDKPIASFFFAGPSGVGKTELCKQLSKNMDIPLIRFDMSEYMESSSVSKLVGSPPGYIGYNNGGQLTDAVRKTPHAVLLFDEIEKAHPDILNMLLQIMDYGTLTDNSGQKADFKNIIFVMTSNVGAKEISKNIIGFNQVKNITDDRINEIKKMLSPEFFNRLDAVVNFNSLDKENIIKVVKKQLIKLQNQLKEKNITMLYTENLVDYIVKDGFDQRMGARPIERYIEKNISQKLAKEILFGTLEQGGEIKIDVKDNEIQFDLLHGYEEKMSISKELVKNIDSIKKDTKKKRVPKKVE